MNYSASLVCWHILDADFRSSLNNYLEDLETSEVRSLKELIDFNNAHSDLELPPGYTEQDKLIKAQDFHMAPEDHKRSSDWIRQKCGPEGIDKTLAQYNIDVIIGPADSLLTNLASSIGKSSRLSTDLFRLTWNSRLSRWSRTPRYAGFQWPTIWFDRSCCCSQWEKVVTFYERMGEYNAKASCAKSELFMIRKSGKRACLSGDVLSQFKICCYSSSSPNPRTFPYLW